MHKKTLPQFPQMQCSLVLEHILKSTKRNKMFTKIFFKLRYTNFYINKQTTNNIGYIKTNSNKLQYHVNTNKV